MPPKRDGPRREHPGPPRASADIQPQELVITIFGAYVGTDPRPAWSGGLVDLLADFGFSPGAARIALNRVIERGLLNRHRDGRFISYSPTPRFLELMDVGERRLARLSQDDPWDGTWTLTWYSISDELRRQRHRLSRRLRFLGFGPLEDSTWVAPHDHSRDVESYLERLRVRQHAGIFVGRAPIAPDAVIARAWESDELALRYRMFVEEFAPYTRRRRTAHDDALVACTRLVNTFRRFPYLDPGLPRRSFPAARERARAVALFQRLYPLLHQPAQERFDALTRRTAA